MTGSNIPNGVKRPIFPITFSTIRDMETSVVIISKIDLKGTTFIIRSDAPIAENRLYKGACLNSVIRNNMIK